MNEPQGTCYTQTAFPHPSVTQPASGMLAKGYVMCNPAPQIIQLATYLYECSAKPAVKDFASLHVDADCAEFEDPSGPTTVAVETPFQWHGQSIAYTNGPEKPGYWYIAVTTADTALPSVSELRSP